MTHHTIINGDARNMCRLEDQSVHLIVTSPPYWQLKDYGHKNQIGFDDSYEAYINNLNLVWHECHRVLHDGCRMVVNIGDQFARSVYYGRYKIIPIREEIIRYCETIGFDYMGAIIWQKKTTMNTSGGATIMGSFPFPRNGIIEIDYEFILLFKKQGISPKVTQEQKKMSEISKEEWREYFSGHWNFGGVKQDKHLAMFPEELPKRIIKMFSFYGETVLDPFMGSGTTAFAAKNLGRNSVGYEINPEFIPLIKNRLHEGLLQETEIKLFVEPNSSWDNTKLAYAFYDPIEFDKKMDVKKLSFGSKIGGDEKKEEYIKVKEILNGNTILLQNDLTIKLAGIEVHESKKEIAKNWLEERVKNQYVSLRFENKKYDEDENLIAKVYLKNKTNINLHLGRVL